MPSALGSRRHVLTPLGLVFALTFWPGCGGESEDDDASAGDDDASVAGDDDAQSGDDDTEEGFDTPKLPGDDDASIPENELEEADWYAENHEQLLEFAEANGGEGVPSDLPLVIFDWDNTSIFNEIGPAFFRYQVLNLAFKVDEGQLEEIVPTAVGFNYDAPANILTVESDQGDVSIADLQADILADYGVLYTRYAGLGCTGDNCQTLDELKLTPEYADFTAKFIFLFEALTKDPAVGPDYTHPMIARLLGGYTETEVRPLAAEVYTGQSEAAIEEVTLTSPNMGRSGQISATWLQGIRSIAEMMDLYDYLRRAGFDLWVVTSVSQPVAQGVTGTTVSGYGVPSTNVVGITLVKRGNNAPLTIELGYPIPYGEGKVAAIDEVIGKVPMLVVGSSEVDYAMLTHYADQALQLVINRNLGCPMSSLYPLALSGNDYLLQGRDDRTGEFRGGQETINFGATSAQTISNNVECP